MAAYKVAVVMTLTELLDSDDKRPYPGKTREWIKRRRENVYLQNIFQEIKVEDRTSFKDKFRMTAID